MHNDEKDTPLTEHLLEQFAAWYLVSVLAVRTLEHARSLHAKSERRRPYVSQEKP